LLHAEEVVEAAMARFNQGGIPLASAEGFIRQIIGWREYINGLYWHFGDLYRNENALAAERPLLPLFTDSTKTEMRCVSTQVSDIEERAWVHHIPRLMVLSNLALITGTSPQEFLDWMRRAFIDAADWGHGSEHYWNESACRWRHARYKTLCCRRFVYFKDGHFLQELRI
jgi:deoxyribodipyrimidine photolyase-related protein